MVLFRSLATLTQAGVMIHEGLAALARSSADKRAQSVLQGLSQAVGNGEPLSTAMERYPNAFATSLSSAVRVGERTGRLVHVLDVVSRDLEKGQRLTYKLRSALAYPLMLSAACGLLMLFGPPYLLAGQLKILSESGQPMPLLTQALIMLSNLTGRPSFLIVFALAVAALGRWAASSSGQRLLWSWARHLPVLGRIVRTTSLARFSRSLSLQLRSGMTALEGLGNARKACSDPELAAALREAEDGLRNGRSLTEAFGDSGYFSVTYLSFIEAGEHSGTLVQLTDWLADFYEKELESELERFVSLAEPVLMMSMGFVTMLLLIATLKPTIAILQTL
jgi:general secretion pathway protein F